MKLDLGDAAFAFDALPRVRVAAVYYAGDEDFPATANVLFDESASHYLPTDALAGVGSALVDRLTASKRKTMQNKLVVQQSKGRIANPLNSKRRRQCQSSNVFPKRASRM